MRRPVSLTSAQPATSSSGSIDSVWNIASSGSAVYAFGSKPRRFVKRHASWVVSGTGSS